jgi:uncharacterized protein YecT (DUF1311 family)
MMSAARLIVVALLSASPFAFAAQCPLNQPAKKQAECYDAAYTSAQDRFDGLYKELRKSLPNRTWAHLKESEILWEKSRDRDCWVEASFAEGDLRNIARSQCMMRLTTDRMHQLRFYLCPRYLQTGQCDALSAYE